jgi:hypothetical protein
LALWCWAAPAWLSTEGDTPCVQGAVKRAMAQVNKAVAEAEKAAKNKG